MKLRTPVLLTLAELYEDSAAGCHGSGKLDVQPGYEALLAAAGCAEGERRELAEDELRTAAAAGVIRLEPIHRRDPRHFSKVRLSPAKEREFYNWIGRESPTARREKWAVLFREAATWQVPERWRPGWAEFCARRAESARHWQEMEPFRVTQWARGKLMLELTARLLAFQSRRYVDYVSYDLTSDSKRLEKWQGSLETLLGQVTGGAVCDFESHGLLPMPRAATLHGPLRLWSGTDLALDAAQLADAATLSVEDAVQASRIETDATRCLIIENKAPFLEIARHRSGVLLVWSSFPNDATVALLKRLYATHPALKFYHHGDTDPAGFGILRNLRKKTDIPIRAHHMRHTADAASVPLTPNEIERLNTLLRDPHMAAEHAAIAALLASGRKGNFEQERHREPPLAAWPFFEPG
jgi:hypothetical protein